MSAVAHTTTAASAQSFEVRPIDAPVGAEIIGLDLTRPLSDDDFARVHCAHLDHALLVFRDQRITPEQQIAFSRHFGPLQIHVLEQFLLADHPENFIISNIIESGQPSDHRDGWGLALFGRGKADIQTHQSAAHNCQRANHLLQTRPKATTVVAHIRKATEGKVSAENTHPFVRDLWSETLAFAHNGDLKDFFPETGLVYRPTGQTDSEREFCHLFDQLASRFENQPGVIKLTAYLNILSRKIANHGTFNFLLSNGSLLNAHCSTEFYWMQRKPPSAGKALSQFSSFWSFHGKSH